MASVFPDIEDNYLNHQWLCEPSILASKNDAVAIINHKLLQQVPGDDRLYKAVDSVLHTSGAVQYPIEFLNSIEVPGVPSHLLHLKVGAPIIILRNLDPPKLCNGGKAASTPCY